VPRKLSIKGWKQELSPFGYVLDRRSRGVFSKSSGKRDLLITTHPAISETAVYIALEVCSPYDAVHDGWAILLWAGLKRNSVPAIGVGRGDFWEPDQSDEALASLIQFGLPWLEEYGTAEKLIDYFGGCVNAALEQQEREKEPPRLFSRLFAKKEPKHPLRPADLWNLARLYFEIGDLDASQDYAERYLSGLPKTEWFDTDRAEGAVLLGSISECKRNLADGSPKPQRPVGPVE
jgi:hypothetical protein